MPHWHGEADEANDPGAFECARSLQQSMCQNERDFWNQITFMRGTNEISVQWQAIVSSNVLYPSMSQYAQAQDPCRLSAQIGTAMREYDTEMFNKGIVSIASRTYSCDQVEVGTWKYCKAFRNVSTSTVAPMSNGTVVVLNELHGNSNVGHASRDAMFLANLVMRYEDRITPRNRG